MKQQYQAFKARADKGAPTVPRHGDPARRDQPPATATNGAAVIPVTAS
jgi:hypothetical protein